MKDKQSHLYIDYVRGLYKVLDRIKETNLMSGRKGNDRIFSGECLMKVEIELFSDRQLNSRIVEVVLASDNIFK